MATVADAIREVSAAAIEPRFAALVAGEVRTKSPGELVTVADEEAEAMLCRRLAGILPGVPVVGEEGCSRDPARLAALRSDRAWLVDPLDGTANFVAGSPDWAVMVALVEGAKTVASWIWLPLRRIMYMAETGGGATRNGDRLLVTPEGRPARPRGAVLRRFLDRWVLDRLDSDAVRDGLGDIGPGRYCAGVEYPLLVEGGQDFILFWRTLPWDHAPGVLLLREAGAAAARPDGSAYRLTDAEGRGLLAAADESTWRLVQRAVFGSAAGYLAETTSR